LFALAFSAGIMYLLQERTIKRKNFGFLYLRLPSLESLDKLNYVCLVFGFPLMTLGSSQGSPMRQCLEISLELGPQGDFCSHHLVHLCHIAP